MVDKTKLKKKHGNKFVSLGLNIAYSGLMASNAALNTTSNNIANVETQGYSRQQAEQAWNAPMGDPGEDIIGHSRRQHHHNLFKRGDPSPRRGKGHRILCHRADSPRGHRRQHLYLSR